MHIGMSNVCNKICRLETDHGPEAQITINKKIFASQKPTIDDQKENRRAGVKIKGDFSSAEHASMCTGSLNEILAREVSQETETLER